MNLTNEVPDVKLPSLDAEQRSGSKYTSLSGHAKVSGFGSGQRFFRVPTSQETITYAPP